MTEAQLSTAVIENPEMLQYQRRQQQLDHKGPAARDAGPAARDAGPAARDTGSASSVAGVVNGESLEDIRKVRARPGAPRTPPAAFPGGWTRGSGPWALPCGDCQLRIFPWAPCSPGVQVRGMGRAQTELGAKTVPGARTGRPPPHVECIQGATGALGYEPLVGSFYEARFRDRRSGLAR